jgi:hypothetical protein
VFDLLNKFDVVDVPTEASYSTESNGKINIHVSVTINAGTLAELKKQRAQNRNSSPVDSGGQRSNSIISAGSDHHQPSNHQTNNHLIKRFSGDTSENVVGDSKARRCCIIA